MSTVSVQPAKSVARVHSEHLAARLEPFDSFCQVPENFDAAREKFKVYYRANYLTHLPANNAASILVISCGPGYLLETL